MQPITPLLRTAILLATLGFSAGSVVRAGTYTFLPTSGTVNWDAVGTWGTSASGPGYPSLAGDVAVKLSGGGNTTTLTQNIVGGVMLGSVEAGGSVGSTWILNATDGITFNNNGLGATIKNDSSNSGASIKFATGFTLTLADDLTISNVNGSSVAGSVILQSVIAGTGNIIINDSSNIINAGQVAFSGVANTFTGSVTIQQGAVTFNNAAAFGGGANVISIGTTGSATLMQIASQGFSVANNIIVGSGNAVLGSTSVATNNATWAGTVTLNGDLTTTNSLTGAGATVLSNVVSGNGGLTVAAGTTRLTGNNTYSGDTRITSGALQIGAASGVTSLALQNSTVNLAGGDTGVVSFGTSVATTITNATFGGLAGSRDLALQNINTTPAAVTLSVGNNNQSTTYSGALSGAGGKLVKIGTGTLTLSGSSSYTGGTTVSVGTLLVNNSAGSATGSGGVTVSSGAMLGGGNAAGTTGFISGAVSLASGAQIAPGQGGAGTLNLQGGLMLNSSGGSLLSFDLGSTSLSSTSDLLRISGGIFTGNSSGLTTVNINQLAGFGQGLYTLVDWTGATASGVDLGDFSLSNGGSFSGGFTGALQISGNTLQLSVSAVPEPATWGLLGFSAGLILIFRRRRPSA